MQEMNNMSSCPARERSQTKRSWMIPGLLTGLLLLASAAQVRASTSITLAWDPSPSPSVAGYRVYYGGASGNYTNNITVGNVTSGIVNGLQPGGTYYFATTARDASGSESAPSNEAFYRVPFGGANLQIRPVSGGGLMLSVTGGNNQTYEILTSTNLTTWTAITRLTLNALGSETFIDFNGAVGPRRFYTTRAVSR